MTPKKGQQQLEEQPQDEPLLEDEPLLPDKQQQNEQRLIGRYSCGENRHQQQEGLRQLRPRLLPQPLPVDLLDVQLPKVTMMCSSDSKDRPGNNCRQNCFLVYI